MRAAAAVLLALAAVLAPAAAGVQARPAGPNAADVRLLARTLRAEHPNLFHDLSRARFQAAVDAAARRADRLTPDQLVVELMRLAALPGVRDGHTGIFPFDPGALRVLHVFPVRMYAFPEGTFVLAQVGAHDLVGARVVAVGGVPWPRVETAVRPLAPHDNASTLLARIPMYAVTAEVLHGLGLIRTVGPTTWTFERNGRRFNATLTPVDVSRYNAAFPDLFYPLVPPGLPHARAPFYLTRRGNPLWTRTLAGGRVWYVGYNLTTAPTADVAARLLRSAAPERVRAVIVDLRNNPGGDNTTYPPLLDALTRISKRKRIAVLISRATFSAAENFAEDLERAAHPLFVGEPSGGSPNLYGDATPTLLRASGLQVFVAHIYWQKSTPHDPRLAIRPQVPVTLTAKAYFAGRDPVLDAAVRASLSR